MDKRIDLNLSPSGDTANILFGQLPEPRKSVKLEFSGNLQTPSEFWLKRNACIIHGSHETAVDSESGIIIVDGNIFSQNDTSYHKSVCSVEFNYTNNTITLTVDEGSPKEITVLGSLIKNPILKELKINNPDQSYTDMNELWRKVKYNRHLFKSAEIHEELLKNLKNFRIQVKTMVAAADDRKGNSMSSRETETIDFPVVPFDLFIPIYVGGPKLEVRIEVEVEHRNGVMHYFLTSANLEELFHIETERAFEEEEPKFNGLAIIKK